VNVFDREEVEMSEAFEKLKTKLAETGTLTDKQRIWLNAEHDAKQRDKQEVITMEQCLAANKALATVEAYGKQA
jgi:hypothetical protein